jgi:opacity protein-like surface antigen
MKVEDDKETSFMFGPTVRYYFGSTNIKPYVHGDVMFGNNKSEEGGVDSKSKVSGWDIGAGVAFFLNDYVAIDLGLGYGAYTGTNDDDDKYKVKASGLAINGGFSIFF